MPILKRKITKTMKKKERTWKGKSREEFKEMIEENKHGFIKKRKKREDKGFREKYAQMFKK